MFTKLQFHPRSTPTPTGAQCLLPQCLLPQGLLPRGLALLGLAMLGLTGCGGPSTPLTIERAFTELPATTIEAPLDLDAAIRHAWLHDRELAAARFRAKAAASDIPGAELRVGGEELGTADGGRAFLAIDPLAWIGAGRRGASKNAAEARSALAWSEVFAIEVEIEESMERAFARAALLDNWSLPTFTLDPKPLDKSGFLSAQARAAVETAHLTHEQEQRALDRARTQIRAEIATHLSWIPPHPEATLPLELPPPLPGPPPIEPTIDEARWLRRPDLARAVAALVVSDAEVRTAAAERYPQLRLGPDLAIGTGGIGGLFLVRLPVFADGPLAAATSRREAARADLEHAIFEARAEISSAERTLAETIDRERLARLERDAADRLLGIARAEASLAPERAGETAAAAQELLVAERSLRDAALARLDAEIVLFYAHGGRAKDRS